VSNEAGLVVNLVALVAILLATYGLGASIAGWRAGLLSTCLVGSYPLLVGLTHTLMVELTMVAFVAGTLYALWRSDGFRHRGWSIAAGVLAGCGMLTKVFFFVFVAGPWFVAVLLSLRGNGSWWSRHRAGNVLLSLLVPAILGSFWYLPNFDTMLSRSIDAGLGAEAAPYGPAHPWHWKNLRNYLLTFVGTGTSFAAFLIFLAGCVGLVVARVWQAENRAPARAHSRYAMLFLGSSIVLGYALFTSLNNQDLKHIAGVMPSVAVLSGWGITTLFHRRWTLVATLILLLSMSQAVLGTFPGLLQNYQASIPVGEGRLALVYPAQSPARSSRYTYPEQTAWPLHELLSYALHVVDLEGLPRDQAHVGVIPDHRAIEEHALRFEAFRQQMPVVISTALVSNLDYQDVLIHKTGDWGFAPSHPAIEKVLAALAQADSGFEPMPRRFALPDGSQALVYARKPSPELAGAPAAQFPVQVTFGEAARFLGLDLSIPDRPETEPKVTITYYWLSLAATQNDLRVFVHLLDPDTDVIVAQDDHPLFPRVYPSTMWQADRYLSERRAVAIPAGFSSSPLKLRLGLYSADGRVPVTACQDGCIAGNDYADVGLIRLCDLEDACDND
jgi:hypothetical protein